MIAQVKTNGFLIPENYVDPKQRPLPFWGQRADRAYLNAVETFAPFAALVLLIQVTGKADAMTAFWAISYFWLRVAHAVVYLAGWPYIRTLIFVLGWICIVGLFVELVSSTFAGRRAARSSFEAGTAEGLDIVLHLGGFLDRHLGQEPGERNVGLRAAQLLQRIGGKLSLAGHGGGCGQHPVARRQSRQRWRMASRDSCIAFA